MSYDFDDEFDDTNYDARLLEHENEATCDCGCLLRRHPDNEFSLTYCESHGNNKARLVAQVYQELQNDSDTFHDGDLGGNIAYLLGAIATGGEIELNPFESMGDWSFHQRLARLFQPEHAIWEHVSVTPRDTSLPTN